MKYSGWKWVPSLYFAEGLPYVLVMIVSVIMYKNLNLSNSEIAFYTSWLYLPWVIKPFWSPFIDLLKTKRWWILCIQLLLGAGLAGIAFFLPTSMAIKGSLCVFWLLAFSSATHDIAADGFYMLGLNSSEQSFFVGIRNTFYRIAMISGQGGLVMLAGKLTDVFGNAAYAWSITFYIAAGIFLALAIYHFFALPKPIEDVQRSKANVGELFTSFFRKKNIGIAFAFILLYRFGEAQLVKIASPFLMDSAEVGGLSLSTTQVGFIYGTIGVIALLIGGIIGGMLVAKNGLKKWIWWMVLAMNIPNLIYVYFAVAQPESFWAVCCGVAIEQLGYGFGFTAFTLYIIQFSRGNYKTAHYAICTGLMSLGMMIPGMFAGAIQETVGYTNFFIWVCICTIPGIVLTHFLKIDDNPNN